MKKFVLTILLFISTGSLAFSQSMFLERGESGFGVGGGFSTSEETYGFTGMASYSISGIADLGILVGRSELNQQLLGEDINTTIIAPFAVFLPVKQNSTIPVSVALEGSYQRQLYSGGLLRNYEIDASGDFFSVGASLFSDIRASEAMVIQPTAAVSILTGETRVEDPMIREIERSSSTFFSLALSLVFDTAPNHKFATTPAVGFQEGATTFGLSIRFIFLHN